MVKKLIQIFMKKSYKWQIKQNLELKNYSKKYW